MNYLEYGDACNPTIILLHGGGLAPWNYFEEAKLLQYRYHVVLPVIDGHKGNKCSSSYISGEQRISDYEKVSQAPM